MHQPKTLSCQLLEGADKLLRQPCLILEASQSTSAAIAQMVQRGTSFAIVLDGDRVQGILTERDVVRLVSSQRNLSAVPLADTMTRNVITVRESDVGDIFQASKLFDTHGVGHLPVVDQSERLIGVLTPRTVSTLLTPEHLLRHIRIRDALLTSAATGHPHESVLTIARRMMESLCGCVAILDPVSRHPLGIITERDIAQFQTLGMDMTDTESRTVMSKPLFTVQQDDSLWSVQEIMQSKHVRRLVVVHPNGDYAGIITQAEILKLLNPVELYRIMEQMQATIDRQTKQLRKLNRTLLRMNDELSREASLDSLTQVNNRRRFDEYLPEVWERLSQEDGELTLLLCDIDFFKAYNDFYGHVEGDRCLYLIAQALKRTVRSSTDLVARYGGEEFAVIMPKCGVVGARRTEQTILEQIRQLSLHHPDSTIGERVTVSVGSATVVFPSVRSPLDLLKLADQNLYTSKRLGRDRASHEELTDPTA